MKSNKPHKFSEIFDWPARLKMWMKKIQTACALAIVALSSNSGPSAAAVPGNPDKIAHIN